MKLRRAIWAFRNVILFVLTASVIVLVFGGQSATIAMQPAQLIANDPGSTINIRQAPSIQADAWYFGKVGDRAQILDQIRGGDGFTWYKLTISQTGVTGWVRGDFVRPVVSASQPKSTLPPIARSPELNQPPLNPAPQGVPSPIPVNVPQPSPIVATAPQPKSPIPLSFPQSANCGPLYPVANPQINFGFGQTPDPFNPGQTRWHNGIDFAGNIGDPVYSPICGTVTYVGREQDPTSYEWGYGWHVKIQDSQGRLHVFGHVSRIYVKRGAIVQAGDRIADVGNNGNTTGPHLHYEIRQNGDTYKNAINPTSFVAQMKSIQQAGLIPVRNPQTARNTGRSL